jgi:hypothetical protein
MPKWRRSFTHGTGGVLGRVAHLQEGAFVGKEFDRLSNIDRNVGL